MYSKNSENVSLSYLAYLQTHINYGLTLWRRTTNNNLKFMQNKVKIAIRIICFKSSNHSTVSMFHEHQILTLKRLRGSIRSRHHRAVLTKIYLLERRWNFNIIISHIFPENFIEVPWVVQEIWTFSPSILTIFINFIY